MPTVQRKQEIRKSTGCYVCLHLFLLVQPIRHFRISNSNPLESDGLSGRWTFDDFLPISFCYVRSFNPAKVPLYDSVPTWCTKRMAAAECYERNHRFSPFQTHVSFLVLKIKKILFCFFFRGRFTYSFGYFPFF